jgi:hypothetical protein
VLHAPPFGAACLPELTLTRTLRMRVRAYCIHALTSPLRALPMTLVSLCLRADCLSTGVSPSLRTQDELLDCTSSDIVVLPGQLPSAPPRVSSPAPDVKV